MRIFFSLVFFLSLCNMKAQTSPIGEGYNDSNDIRKNIRGIGTWIKNNNTTPTIKGSTYLFDSWNNNAKLYVDNKVYIVKEFNFNVQNQRFEAKFSEDSVLIMNTSKIKKIIIRDKVFNRLELEDNTSNPFFEVIGSFDNSILLKKYDLDIQEGSFNHMTQKLITPSVYIIKEAYFTANLDGTNVKETKLKKSTILKLFDQNKQEKVKDFVSENHLSFKDEDDVQQIFHYTNTL